MKIVECVPNFSEGRDRRVIDAIAQAIREVDGVRLLDVDPGAATNRTVMTFVGEPEPVCEAAFRAIRAAADLIDMRRHSGAHPRQGATDVCPFVPVSGLTLDDCASLARAVGERVGRELGISVYLYEHAASRPERRSLQNVRAGEYEGLAQKLATPEGAPDYGPRELNARAGATAIGARKFLIAYNVDLDTRDLRLAKAIAWRIRDSEGPVLQPGGAMLRDETGKLVKRLGQFTNCKATGWVIEEYGCAQVTMNLTDWEVTPIHAVFDACCRIASELGVRVTGSEIVGLVPRAALSAAGAHYLARQGASPGAPTSDLVAAAIRSLGLCDVAPFDPAKKIVEEALRDTSALAEQPLARFADLVSAGTPAPGGGSVAAAAAALAASLAAMVSNLTAAAKGHEAKRRDMVEAARSAQALKEGLLQAVDLDARSYRGVLAAMRLPKKTDEEKAARAGALARANAEAAAVPMSVLERTIPILELARHLLDAGLPASLCDVAVASAAADAAAAGACYNVLYNLQGLGDPDRAAELRRSALDLVQQARRLADDIRSVSLGRLTA
jgi:glutamate formiminotransferase/formiminotetrahydrofolate cyclodeaminase